MSEVFLMPSHKEQQLIIFNIYIHMQLCISIRFRGEKIQSEMRHKEKIERNKLKFSSNKVQISSNKGILHKFIIYARLLNLAEYH